MKKKIVIWIVAVSVFLIITAGLLCWAAYENQPTFCGLTRSELETYDLYFGETLITDPEVKDQVITCCLNMDFYRHRINYYELLLGGTTEKVKYLYFQKGDEFYTRYILYFEKAYEQLSWEYIHRDRPIVTVTCEEKIPPKDNELYSVVKVYTDYYTLSPEDYSKLLKFALW